MPAYFSIFQAIPAYSSLFQHITAYCSLSQPILAYTSVLKPIPAFSSLERLDYLSIFKGQSNISTVTSVTTGNGQPKYRAYPDFQSFDILADPGKSGF